MNYLAHALLSPDDPEVLMGNLWGDLLRPKDFQGLKPGVLSGIGIHRRIDAFTDRHQSVVKIISLLRPHQGKYTPVVVDVLMDFMLSKYWQKFHRKSIEKFCKKKYKLVKRHLPLIPERLHPRIGRMLENEWLESCKNRQRMERTLIMLSHRASFENKIPEAMQAYDLHGDVMDGLFLPFFEELQHHVSLQNAG